MSDKGLEQLGTGRLYGKKVSYESNRWTSVAVKVKEVTSN
jgi:hypothetical protein